MMKVFDKNLIIAELGVFEGDLSKRIKEICREFVTILKIS
jgi:hypothetical protein